MWGGVYHSRGHGESQEMWYLKDWGRNPHPRWRGIERGWVLVSRCRASSIFNEVTDCGMWWDYKNILNHYLVRTQIS